MTAPDELHPAIAAMLPGLARLGWAPETRSDCDRCPMLEAHGEHPNHAFAADARCCTHHPPLANFAAGRALAAGGESAEAVRRRLAEPSGVGAWGIRASEAWQGRLESVGHVAFGIDRGLRCPYWRGGQHACAVWRDRPSTCRTWFCRHEGGYGGALLWDELRLAIAGAEDAIARALVTRGEPPAGDVTIEGWCAWYLDCHGRAADVAGTIDASDPVVVTARRRVDGLPSAPEPRPMPNVLVPSVAGTDPHGDRVRVTGYSSYDPATVPANVFAFFAALDGRRPWREAAAMIQPPMPESAVRELWRVGALEAPTGPSLGERLVALE